MADQGMASGADFATAVIQWQAHGGRHDLPWQKVRDPYRIWLSEIMLQQTQVAAVLGYYRRFLATFPDVDQLAAAPLERVMELWSGLGYYSRARHLHACARRVVSEFAGVFPSDPAVLATLPGIGRSTAAAIAVFSAGVRAAILDGNVKRVLCRVYGIDGYPGEPRVHQRLWTLAEELLPESGIEAYTQGLMDLGATLCTARKPRCATCFLKTRCRAWQTGRVAELPERKPARHLPERKAVLLVLHHAGHVLLQKRPAPGVWGGLWSLPEWPAEAGLPAARALAERYAKARGAVSSTAQLSDVVHGFSHFRLQASVWAIDLAQREPAPAESDTERWVDLEDVRAAALPAPIKKLLVGLWRLSPLHGSRAAAGPRPPA